MDIMNGMYGNQPLPQDDTMMQVDMQRRLKLADNLRNQAAPEGQMVSGRYVPASWTQHLANALGKVQADKTEQQAMKQYGEYQQGKAKKYADLLSGKEVTQPVDYTDVGNIPGMEQTTRQPYNQQEFTSNLLQIDPSLAGKIAENQLTQYTKDRTPVSVGKGASLVDPTTGKVVFQNTPEITDIAKVDADKFEPTSIAKFQQTRNYADLVPVAKPDALKAPPFRTIMQGGNEIQQELQKDGTWKEVGRGSRFKPEAPIDEQNVNSTAAMIASGQIAPLTSSAMKSPWGQKVMTKVAELNPDFSGANFKNTTRAEADFNTGKQGNTVRSLNVATSHLNTLGTLADALNNNDTRLLNTVSNAWKTQTGSPAPTNFEAARNMAADEVVKAIIGSGGSLEDRKAAVNTINSAGSLAQLKGVIETYKHLLGGQLEGLRQQYETSTGKKDFNKYLSADVKGNKQAELPKVNSKNWVLHTDAKGNKAYVSPDGKQYEEVK